MSEHAHGHQDIADMFSEGAWEQRYGTGTAVWSGRPNAQLVAEASGLPVGTALDIGCGEGADAIWLAERGWRVTAVDFATNALAHGAAQAERRGADVAARIEWVHADVTAWQPGEQRFDLVSAQFVQLLPQPRTALFARLAAAVAPGGTLLVVGHDMSDLDTTVHRAPLPDMFFTADEVAAGLDPGRWEVEAAGKRPRPTTDPEGAEVTIHDAVLRARRLA